MLMSKRTLVIGDCHGHFDRLEALLLQEGVLGECHDCKGTGESGESAPWDGLCLKCHGDGFLRVNRDVEVVQLGDLGHFGSERREGMYGGTTVSGSSTADTLCWDAAVRKDWIDVILWGNHDRAVVDSHHEFGGYIPPPLETVNIIEEANLSRKLKLTHVAHGYLLTHAGLHAAFKYQRDVPPETKTDPQAFSDWINAIDFEDLTRENGPRPNPIRDNIGTSRFGRATEGGILWRDASEKLYDTFKQIFGHSRGDKVRRYKESKETDWSWCVDIGSQTNGRLAGIWLPDPTDKSIVSVKISK